MESIIAEIEKDLIKKRIESLKRLPKPIFDQIERIEEKVFELWQFDSVYTGTIRIECLDACTSSMLTLDQIEDILKSHGEKLKKNSFKKAIKLMKKKANKAKKNQGSLIERMRDAKIA